MEKRIIDLELCVASQERTIEELSDEVFRLSKQVDILSKQMKNLIDAIKESPVKPLSEETRPPHY